MASLRWESGALAVAQVAPAFGDLSYCGHLEWMLYNFNVRDSPNASRNIKDVLWTVYDTEAFVVVLRGGKGSYTKVADISAAGDLLDNIRCRFSSY